MASLETRTVKLNDMKRFLIKHFDKNRSVMVWGPPGAGKSETVASIVHDYNAAGKRAKLIDVRLSLWDPTDIKGIPFFDSVDQKMKWAPPEELPSADVAKEYDIIILFLDELNGAPPAVQAAAYQLILDRRVGAHYVLPDNVKIVAAGNRESDKGVTYRMPKPLSNRMIHYEIRVDYNTWLDWAVMNDIHPDVIGYVTTKKGDLMRFDPKSAERSFPTPRTWTYVSEILNDATGMAEKDIEEMVHATIGEGTGIQFIAHRKMSSKLPDPRRILKGEVTELQVKEISAMYSLATSIAYELRELDKEQGKSVSTEDMEKYFNNAMTFWLENFDSEMIIMSIRLALKTYKVNVNIAELPAFDVLTERYGDLIKTA